MIFLRADPHNPVLAEAVAILAQGGVIAYPTETVYGLGAAISCHAALLRISAIKGRSGIKALSYMVDSVARALALSGNLPGYVHDLIQRYWPGPLTLVVEASPDVPGHAVSENGTIGLRMPDNQICRTLVGKLDDAIATTSANVSGEPPACSAEAVYAALGEQVDLIIDGGTSRLAISSTVLDVTGKEPALLRQGAIPFSDIINNMR